MTFADLLHSSTALFLDFDGTLVDIADQPDGVQVPAGLVETLSLLNGYLGGALAVVSGRPIGQVDDFLRPLRIAAAGVHGTERRAVNGEMTLLSTHPLDAIELTARELASQYAGLLVEAKPGGASKGGAIEDFMREPPFAGRAPLFVGDDITDEVGFFCVQRMGGLGVKVGEGPSVAWQRIATPELLRQQLHDAVAARTGRASA